MNKIELKKDGGDESRVGWELFIDVVATLAVHQPKKGAQMRRTEESIRLRGGKGAHLGH